MARWLHIALVLLLAATLTACTRNDPPEQAVAESVPLPTGPGKSFAGILTAAQNAQKAAAAVGAEWIQTDALIDQARQEAEQGNWDMAIELAIKAKQQGELAVIQAEREAIAWRNRVVQ